MQRKCQKLSFVTERKKDVSRFRTFQGAKGFPEIVIHAIFLISKSRADCE